MGLNFNSKPKASWLIEDARNEFEKAYGPLYTLVSEYEQVIAFICNLELLENEKNYFDKIVATYPFMFPSEIFEFLEKNLRTMTPSFIGATEARTVYVIP